MGRIRVGTSGWSYDDWRGDFYPSDLAKGDELRHAATVFETVEINRTFYSLCSPGVFRRWYRDVPAGFVFAVKGSRFITHSKKLSEVETPLANFFASGLLELREKLGPILWQLPEGLGFDPDRVERFLSLLPHDTESLARVAARHDDRVEDVSLTPDRNHRLRHALEPRHPDFFTPELVRMVRRHGVALAFSHSSEWEYTEEITAGFVYLRLHGPDQVYASAYGPRALDDWTERMRVWRDAGEPPDAARITDRVPPRRKGRDVYVYFDNDAGGHAPREAREVIERLRR